MLNARWLSASGANAFVDAWPRLWEFIYYNLCGKGVVPGCDIVSDNLTINRPGQPHYYINSSIIKKMGLGMR